MAGRTYTINKLGLEDLIFGTGTQVQLRNGVELVVTEINAKNLPFDEANTLQEVLDNNYPSIDAVTITTPGGKVVNPAIIAVADKNTYLEIIGTDLNDADSTIKLVAQNMTYVQEVGTVAALEKITIVANDIDSVTDVASDLALGANSLIGTSLTNAQAAATSASQAAASATAASDSASNAATSESNAAGSATSASNSASTAASHLASIELIFDSFDDRYLGAKANDPTTDNDGNPLQAGAIYWNTTLSHLKFYSGTQWEDPDASATASAQAAATSASNAATSETNAGTSASNASASASSAATSATNASNSASSASTSATNASNSASSAATSASNASTSATNASNSASSAATSASNAATSESNAEGYAQDAYNATANKVDKVAMTDNAIVRANGTAGAIQGAPVYIDDNGNIGVGVSSLAGTDSLLIDKVNNRVRFIDSVSGSKNISIGQWDGSTNKIESSGADFQIAQYNGNIRFGTGSANERMRITDTGNILMGTTTDNGVDKLQVNGNLKIYGSINTGFTTNTIGAFTEKTLFTVRSGSTVTIDFTLIWDASCDIHCIRSSYASTTIYRGAFTQMAGVGHYNTEYDNMSAVITNIDSTRNAYRYTITFPNTGSYNGYSVKMLLRSVQINSGI